MHDRSSASSTTPSPRTGRVNADDAPSLPPLPRDPDRPPATNGPGETCPGCQQPYVGSHCPRCHTSRHIAATGRIHPRTIAHARSVLTTAETQLRRGLTGTRAWRTQLRADAARATLHAAGRTA